MVRSYHNYGAPDSNAGPTLAAAAAAGISSRGIYHFPCAYGKDAAQQVRDDINAVSGGSYDRLWFDIETNPDGSCSWSQGSASQNCQFLQTMIQTAQGMGVAVGIYASSYMWSSIMGASCTVGADLPIWYAGYTGVPSFSDWRPFGGWTSPTIHQYSDSSSIANGCGFGADANWAQ